jgi:hypothetical protein
MSPVGDAVEIRKNYHFTSPQQREKLWGIFLATKDVKALGLFMHAFQDSFSHADYGPRFGHAKDGHEPDWTFMDPEKAVAMGMASFDRLVAAGKTFEENGKPVSRAVVEKIIRNHIAEELRKHKIEKMWERINSEKPLSP